jgi:hypothetical protein
LLPQLAGSCDPGGGGVSGMGGHLNWARFHEYTMPRDRQVMAIT